MIRWPLFLVKLGSNSWEKKRDGFPHKRLWIISQKWGPPKEKERQPECLFSFFLCSLLIALLSGIWALTNHSSCPLSFSLRFDYFDMNKPNSYLRMVTSQTLQLFCKHLWLKSWLWEIWVANLKLVWIQWTLYWKGKYTPQNMEGVQAIFIIFQKSNASQFQLKYYYWHDHVHVKQKFVFLQTWFTAPFHYQHTYR